jgi:PKD repeat protein
MHSKLLAVLACLFTLVLSTATYAGSKWVRLGWMGNAKNEATVSFTPSGSNNSPYVKYGYSTNESAWTSTPVTFTTSMASITSKHVRLRNLTPDSAVYFRVCDSSGCGDRFWFRTAPDDNSPFVVVAGGDTRTGWTNRQQGNRLVAKIRPLFVMHGGDFTNSNNNSEWSQWLTDWELTYSNDTIDGYAYKRIYPLISTHGNHEDNDISTICKMFGVDANRNNSCSANDTYYSVDVSPLLRVYTLNSQFQEQSSTLQNAQNNWLSSDLHANGSNATWRFAQYHKPMFPHSTSKSDNPALFRWWAQLFYDYAMNVVVESDTHITKLTDVVAPNGSTFSKANSGTVYVGEGSWGAPARSANDPKSWTLDLASIQQFKVITVSSEGLELRTAQFNSSAGSLSKDDRDADTTRLPNNVNWWKANGVGETLALTQDGASRSVRSDGTDGGNGPSTSLSASDDTFISSRNVNSNYNGSGDQLLADGSDSTYGEIKALIKWNTASIPACATVESASIGLTIFNASSGTYAIYQGRNSWNEGNASWNSVNGASHQGSQLASFNPGSSGQINVPLNSAGVSAVQSWVSGGSNQGIVIASVGTSDGIDFNDRENGSAPKLVITWNENNCGGNTNQPPTANFSTNVSNLNVAFQDLSSDSDGSIVSWSWTFGNGARSSQKNPAYSYPSAGTYTVSLTVTDNDGASKSTSKSVTVSAPSQTSYQLSIQNGSGSGSYIAGSKITITANTPPSGKEFDRWQLLSGSASIAQTGSATTTLTMGSSAVTVAATYKDKPVSAPLLSLPKTSYEANESIVVSYANLPGNSDDWISLFVAGASNSNYGQWSYTNGARSGTITFNGLAPGNYEVRLFFNDSYTMEYKISFTVKASAPVQQLSLNKSSYARNEAIIVDYANLPGNSRDWISVYKAGASNRDYGQWFYTGGKTSGRMTFDGLATGNYEIRLFYNDSYTVESSAPFTVN